MTKQTTSRRALGGRWIEARSKGATYRLRLPAKSDRVPSATIMRSNLPAAVREALLLDGSKVNAEHRVEISTSGREGVVLRYVEAKASTSTRALEERAAAFAPVSHDNVRKAPTSTGRLLRGYGAVFDTWTDISDRLGTFRERVAHNAFAESLKTRTPILQFEHGEHATIGTLPLGKFTTIREDKRGLYVEAPLTDSWMVEPVRAAVADGSLNGMSFRFTVNADKWTKGADGVEERTLLSVTCFEVGVVSMAAYPTTSAAVS